MSDGDLIDSSGPVVFKLRSPEVKIKLTDPAAKMPQYAKEGDAGADVFSIMEATIFPGETVLIDVGLTMELPKGWECQVRSRSGLACKGIVCANSPGTVDEGYRGPIKVILHNNKIPRLSAPGFAEPYKVAIGDKVAQLVFKPVSQASFTLVDSLAESQRGTGGLGSTGK